jgi:hypothetical protein
MEWGKCNMAGLSKPTGVGVEMTDYVVNGGVNQYNNTAVLFNGTAPSALWDVNCVFWAEGSNYVDITINKSCNLYAFGCWDAANGAVFSSIQKYNGTSWVNVTANYTQVGSRNGQWVLSVPKLSAGRYRFYSAYRLDSEWYFESIPLNALLKQGGQYYSIKPEFYNTSLLQYTPLSSADITKGFVLSDLFTTVTYGTEPPFKPISKFSDFQIILSEANTAINIKGIKTTKELIVANDDITTSLAHNIDYFKILANTSGADNIKLALSIDNGVTWKTWDAITSNFIDLNCVIPTTPYAQMTSTELSQWETAKELIYTNGINSTLFNTLNFNLLPKGKIRFAYVLYRPTYSTLAETTQLDWKFDAEGSMQRMTDAECTVNIQTKQIKLISKVSNSIVNINVLI